MHASKTYRMIRTRNSLRIMWVPSSASLATRRVGERTCRDSGQPHARPEVFPLNQSRGAGWLTFPIMQGGHARSVDSESTQCATGDRPEKLGRWASVQKAIDVGLCRVAIASATRRSLPHPSLRGTQRSPGLTRGSNHPPQGRSTACATTQSSNQANQIQHRVYREEV